MSWIIEYWFLVVVACAAVGLTVYFCADFTKKPTTEQIAKVKEWLLYAVILAEKELGNGTGQLKLRYVYDLFLQRFPALVTVISFELFSNLVDEVLEQMKHILDTNLDIAVFVKERGK